MKKLPNTIISVIFSGVLISACSSNSENLNTSTANNSAGKNARLEKAYADALNAINTAAQKAMEQMPGQFVGKRALVITQNANLRRSDNGSSEVIQTIAENTNVEWMIQRGAWFLVSHNGKSGWMHGNTLKLLPATVSIRSGSEPTSPDSSSDIMRKISEECARQRAAGDESPLCDDVRRNGIP